MTYSSMRGLDHTVNFSSATEITSSKMVIPFPAVSTFCFSASNASLSALVYASGVSPSSINAVCSPSASVMVNVVTLSTFDSETIGEKPSSPFEPSEISVVCSPFASVMERVEIVPCFVSDTMGEKPSAPFSP